MSRCSLIVTLTLRLRGYSGSRRSCRSGSHSGDSRIFYSHSAKIPDGCRLEALTGSGNGVPDTIFQSPGGMFGQEGVLGL